MTDYNSQAASEKWNAYWQQQNIYTWHEDEPRANNYVIDAPPPTVSGTLHMGHVFSYTQADVIARFQRLLGKNVFYTIGFDDNGLPTERLVEKVKKVRGRDMPRSEFVNLCREVIVDFENQFRQLFTHLGLSVDWRQSYQTISDKSQALSQMSFIDLYHKGLIVQREGPTFWDSIDGTAIAQTEMEDKEQRGVIYTINFDTAKQQVAISTTRPELIPACVGLFYHPNDERYRHLDGCEVFIPFTDRTVIIRADEDVAMDKGTGLVMCCTFGDIQDIHWWRRHNLNTIKCITNDGKICNSGFLDGLRVKDGRVAMIDRLQSENRIIQQEEVLQHVKCAERSGAPLEIIITHQWYIKVLDYKEQIQALSEQCSWYPSYMRGRLRDWVNGLNQEWCISRQRFFGVPFPVWYSLRPGEEGRILLPNIDQLPVDPHVDLPPGYKREEVQPNTDVMDTWATSAISPQLSSYGVADGYMLDAERHARLFPADLRPQAHEIIRTWAFGSLVKSLHHTHAQPWHSLMISGWCLAADKSKMSKSKGNTITPDALIVERSPDVVRYWATSTKLGTDIIYSEDAFKIGQRLVNKLWNAAKFVAIHLIKARHELSLTELNQEHIQCDLDWWIIAKLSRVITQVTNFLLNLDYYEARAAIEGFFWQSFCGHYIEMVKARIYDDDTMGQSAIVTAHYCLNVILRLLSPFIPYITEEIYAQFLNAKQSIHRRGNWPKALSLDDTEAGDAAVKILELVHKYKSLAGLSLKSSLSRVVFTAPNTISSSLLADLGSACNAQVIEQNTSNNQLDLMSDCQKFSITVQV